MCDKKIVSALLLHKMRHIALYPCRQLLHYLELPHRHLE